MVCISSTPAPPLLDTTFLKALFMLPLATILSRVIGSKLMLLISYLSTTARPLPCYYPHVPRYSHISSCTFALILSACNSLLWLHCVAVPPTFTLVGFGPSRIVIATTTSADFLSFVVTTVLPLTRSAQVRAFSFTPYIRHLYIVRSV